MTDSHRYTYTQEHNKKLAITKTDSCTSICIIHVIFHCSEKFYKA